MKTGHAMTITNAKGDRRFFVEKRRNVFSAGFHYPLRELLPEHRENYIGIFNSMAEVRAFVKSGHYDTFAYFKNER